MFGQSYLCHFIISTDSGVSSEKAELTVGMWSTGHKVQSFFWRADIVCAHMALFLLLTLATVFVITILNIHKVLVALCCWALYVIQLQTGFPFKGF